MAAVLCLIFLPIALAIVVLFGTISGFSLSSVLMAATFLVMSGGIVIGLMNMFRGWEAGSHDG